MLGILGNSVVSTKDIQNGALWIRQKNVLIQHVIISSAAKSSHQTTATPLLQLAQYVLYWSKQLLMEVVPDSFQKRKSPGR